MSELKGVAEFLVSVATELESYIDEKNKELKAAITSQDLDDPDYHDYQTCFELMKLSNKIAEFESKHSISSTT